MSERAEEKKMVEIDIQFKKDGFLGKTAIVLSREVVQKIDFNESCKERARLEEEVFDDQVSRLIDDGKTKILDGITFEQTRVGVALLTRAEREVERECRRLLGTDRHNLPTTKVGDKELPFLVTKRDLSEKNVDENGDFLRDPKFTKPEVFDLATSDEKDTVVEDVLKSYKLQREQLKAIRLLSIDNLTIYKTDEFDFGVAVRLYCFYVLIEELTKKEKKELAKKKGVEEDDDDEGEESIAKNVTATYVSTVFDYQILPLREMKDEKKALVEGHKASVRLHLARAVSSMRRQHIRDQTFRALTPAYLEFINVSFAPTLLMRRQKVEPNIPPRLLIQFQIEEEGMTLCVDEYNFLEEWRLKKIHQESKMKKLQPNAIFEQSLELLAKIDPEKQILVYLVLDGRYLNQDATMAKFAIIDMSFDKVTDEMMSFLKH